jgi:hypothetical protein
MSGLSQAGKVITIYPSDDDQLIWLALELDKLFAILLVQLFRITAERPYRPFERFVFFFAQAGFQIALCFDAQLVGAIAVSFPLSNAERGD